MPKLRTSCLTLVWLTFAFGSATAHYNMLLPQPASAKKGETIALLYQWGHPFAPDGKKTEWKKGLEKISVAGETSQVTAFRTSFIPDQRGDYLLVLKTAPIWIPEEREFFEDTVKVILHVQVQKGWDAAAGLPFELVPLTRPYGLHPGMVFQAQLDVLDGKAKTPGAGTLVEIEHYHQTQPAALPPDEHITRTAKTDANGVVTCTLTEPGWWCLTAAREGGTREHDGKQYPVRQRCTLWVFVDEPPTVK